MVFDIQPKIQIWQNGRNSLSDKIVWQDGINSLCLQYHFCHQLSVTRELRLFLPATSHTTASIYDARTRGLRANIYIIIFSQLAKIINIIVFNYFGSRCTKTKLKISKSLSQVNGPRPFSIKTRIAPILIQTYFLNHSIDNIEIKFLTHCQRRLRKLFKITGGI